MKGAITLLGYCGYFLLLDKEKKEIPPTTVDIGCKFWRNKKKDHPLLMDAIIMFKGILL